MDERHDAEHSVAQARQRLSHVAEELSRRASGDYFRKQVRERTYEMTGRLVEKPWAGSLLGGAAGMLAGRVLTGRLRESRRFRPESERLGSGREEEGLAERTGETLKGAAETVKERASGVKDRASGMVKRVKEGVRESVSSVRERIPSKERLRHTAQTSAKRLRSSTEDNVGMWAVGALVSGALLGALIPSTRKEGRILRPAGQKVQQQFSNLKDQAAEKGKVVQEKVKETLSEVMSPGPSEQGEQSRQQSEAGPPEFH